MPAQTIIKVRRDTAANWASSDPALAAGEHGYETDTGKFKIGDGTTHYILLPYATDWANVTEKPTEFTPADHAASHTDGGTDEITVAPAQITASPTSGQVLSSDGTTTVWSTPSGGLPTQGTDTSGEMLISNGAGGAVWSNTVTANAANVPAIIAKATGTYTANIQEWQPSGSTIPVARVTNSGGIISASALQSTTSQDGSGFMYGGQININGGGMGFATVDVRAGAGNQASNNLTNWRDSGNNIIASISPTGLLTANPAAPANANTAKAVGYVGLPQVLLASGGLALSAAHAGDHIYVTATGLTVTIPSNTTTPLEIGTTFVIINGNVTTTISKDISTDILWLAGSATQANTLTRTLAPYGMATIVKIAQVSGGAATWMVSGNGLT